MKVCMKSLPFITLNYEGHAINITNDGWFDATTAAAKYGKKPVKWLELPETQRYMAALARLLNVRKSDLYKSKPGRFCGGTWLHPKLAVAFARWLDDDFSLWCDLQIEEVIRSKHKWGNQRSIAASSAKLLASSVKESRKDAGKETEEHHYACEHKLVNSLLTGEYKPIDRDGLTEWQLDFIAHFDVRASMMNLKGMTYSERKAALQAEANEWRAANAHRIQAANDPGPLAA